MVTPKSDRRGHFFNRRKNHVKLGVRVSRLLAI